MTYHLFLFFITANTIEKIEWLKKNVQPVDQVKNYWRETFDVRQSNWKNENKAESSPFIYECLKTDLGVDLVINISIILFLVKQL